MNHYMDRFQNWEASPTPADPVAYAVTAQVGDLNLFALTVGPPSAAPLPLSQKRNGTGL